jgi:circadian clock protein KaiB
MTGRVDDGAHSPASPAGLAPHFHFRLYIAGGTPNSIQANANIIDLCRERLADHYELELVDLFREPMRAMDDGILMTPTLVRLAPSPVVRIVGTLSDRAMVAMALELPVATP